MNMKRKIAYALVSAVLVVFLLTQIRLQDVVMVFSTVNYLYLSLAFLFYVLTYLLKSFRFHLFLREIRFYDMFKIVSLHNLANVVLPARTGELSFVYLTKTRGIKSAHGLAVLAMVRLFDLLVVSISIIITAFLIEKTSIDTLQCSSIKRLNITFKGISSFK